MWCCLLSCSTQKSTISNQFQEIFLKLIDVKELPYNADVNGTTLGGLSGIDYDSIAQVYYAICDDRSSLQAARFYTLSILFDKQKIDTIRVQKVTTLLQQNGLPYPSSKENPALTPDPEAIRYNPVTGMFIWTSEGERIVTAKDTVLANPSINLINATGHLVKSYPIPGNLQVNATEQGPRRNGVLEGLSFARQYQRFYVSLEEPRYEDGPQADTVPNEAWIRIYEMDAKTGKNTAQYAYRLDPVAYPAIPATAFKINGVPDILDMGNGKLLVMERSFSTGRLPCSIKIFEVDLRTASDISRVASLMANPPRKPLQKKLVLNLDSLGIYTDNIEGMTFGPRFSNGNRSLLMIADNNFSILEKTQVLLFEVNTARQ